MNKATKFVLFLVIIGFTFSYFILDILLPKIISNCILIKMSLWALVMLISYSIYTWLTIHKRVPSAIHWSVQSKASRLLVLLVLLLAIIAVLFPSPHHNRLDMLYIVGMAVIGEEILFRGLLWDLLDGYLGDNTFFHLSATIWLTGLAFGVMHFQYHHFQVHLASIVQVSYSFVIGLLLGVIRKGTKSVVPPIFAHSAFNSMFNLFLTAVS